MTIAVGNVGVWEKRRAALSHDVLKNEIIPAVFKLANIISGRVEDPDFEAAFATSIGPKIQRLCTAVEELAHTAEDALTPRQFFEEAPLRGVDGETRQWLPAVVHSVWVEDACLQQRVQRLTATARSVSGHLAHLNAGLGVLSPALLDRDARNLLESLHALAVDLAAMAKALPYRI